MSRQGPRDGSLGTDGSHRGRTEAPAPALLTRRGGGLATQVGSVPQPSLQASAVVLAGDRSFLPPALFEQQAAQGSGLPLQVVPGAHFLLQEYANRAAKLLPACLCCE